MMVCFEQIADGIWRLKVPFEDIYTSVYVLQSRHGVILADCASNEQDVQKYIVPALADAGFEPKIILCSHLHGDHAGGLEGLVCTFPDAKVALYDHTKRCKGKDIHYLEDAEVLFERYMVLHLSGHSPDSIALYDMETKTLLSFDCLQQGGITRYGTSVTDYRAYLKGIARVRNLHPACIIAAHEYVPLGAAARGETAVEDFLDCCEADIENIRNFAMENVDMEDEAVAALFNLRNPEHPLIHGHVIAAVRKDIARCY